MTGGPVGGVSDPPIIAAPARFTISFASAARDAAVTVAGQTMTPSGTSTIEVSAAA